MKKVADLNVAGAPSGAVYTLTQNPGDYFSIRGSELWAASHTPAGTHTVGIRATGNGVAVDQVFTLQQADAA